MGKTWLVILILLVVISTVGVAILSVAVGGQVASYRSETMSASPIAKGQGQKIEAAVDQVISDVKPEDGVPDTIVSFIAVGDIMLSRNVAEKIKKYQDVNYPFASTTGYLQSADFVFANLEAPITPGPVVPTGSFTFHADPGVEKALASANFKVVSLANNHFLNYGKKGIEDSLELLSGAGIKTAGAGLDDNQAYAPAYVEAGNIKFAFLAYSYKTSFNDGAAPGRAGIAKMDLEKLRSGIAQAQGEANIVIVSMHAGTEYTEELTAEQTEFARAAIDYGADLVIGHHPHVTQRVEKYKDKYIFYSLGNFIFDQMWSEETRRGAAVKFYFDKNGLKNAEVQPTVIFNYSRPQPAERDIAEQIWQRLRIEPTNTEIILAD